MKWKIGAVIVAVIVLVALYSFSVGGGTKKKRRTRYASVQSGEVVGDSSAPNTLYLLSSISSEVDAKIHLNFLNGLKDKLEESLEVKLINIKIILPTDLDKILSQDGVDFKGNLLVVPAGNYLEKSVLEKLHQRSLTTILYASEDGRTCIGNNQSPYLWNFGITPSMYSESYFSYANQRYGQLAKALTFLTYSNIDKISVGEELYFRSVIEGLGFSVLASVKVDSREEDLYSVLREIINFSPRILMTSANSNGVIPFLKQSHKLGFGFEMSIFLSEGIPDEAIFDLGKDLDGVVKPSIYLNSLESDAMTTFRKDREVDGVITTSFYRGYILSEIIDKVAAKFKANKNPINFSRGLLEIDGTRINAPSGSMMIHSRARGLIQPLHVGEFKDGKFNYLQYLGDMSPPENCP